MSDFTIPKNDPIRTEARKARAQRRVGIGACCASCAERRPEALTTGSKPIACAKCQRIRKGKTTVDRHHVAGKNNSPVTIEVPVNDHRAILSPAQQDWPRKTLENPDGDPVLAGAAIVRGFIDTAVYLLRELLLRVARMLEFLSGYMKENLGSQWWV